MEKVTETMNDQVDVNNSAQEAAAKPEEKGQQPSAPGVTTTNKSQDSAEPGEGSDTQKNSAAPNANTGNGSDSRGRSLSPELRKKYKENPYVLAINNVGDFTYTHSFYVDMHGYIHYGQMTYEEAYERLGFKISELGVNRALSAGKRAMRMAEDGTLNKVSPGKFNGTIPLEVMQLDKMDLAEQIGQLTARVIYLETVNKTQKKTFFMREIKR